MLSKLRKMKKFTAYGDIHLLDTNYLDKFFENVSVYNTYNHTTKSYYFQFTQADDFESLSFLELADKFNRMDTENLLRYLDQTKDWVTERTIKSLFNPENLVNAFYLPTINKICTF